LLTPLSEVEVEALPEELPENIEVNVESLANLDEQITVADLKIATGVTVLTDGSQVVAKIGEMMKEEEPEPVDETQLPEVIGEKPAEGEEGTTEEASEDKDK
jgi:large subunit ribosomal protein L25